MAKKTKVDDTNTVSASLHNSNGDKIADLTFPLEVAPDPKLMRLSEAMPLLNVKFASLSKEAAVYSFFERIPGGDFRQVDIKKSSTVCHPDLLNAFEAFNGHLAVICEEVPSEDVTDIEKLKADNDPVEERMHHFHVTGVVFDGGAAGAVLLQGHKILSTGELLGLETPKININPEYIFYNELHAAVTTLMEEISLYYYGKAAVNPQQDLFKSEVENQ